MTTEPLAGHDGTAPSDPAHPHPGGSTPSVDSTAEPTAGMVLHRVLATAARTFLLNDMAEELVDGADPKASVDALSRSMEGRPLWAQSAVESLDGTRRRATEVERIHQSRVAMRRIRSNLRTFRLALDPAWGVSLRAELAWYGGRLGEVRDLHIISDILDDKGPDAVGPDQLVRLRSVLEEPGATLIKLGRSCQ